MSSNFYLFFNVIYLYSYIYVFNRWIRNIFKKKLHIICLEQFDFHVALDENSRYIYKFHPRIIYVYTVYTKNSPIIISFKCESEKFNQTYLLNLNVKSSSPLLYTHSKKSRGSILS